MGPLIDNMNENSIHEEQHPANFLFEEWFREKVLIEVQAIEIEKVSVPTNEELFDVIFASLTNS